MEARFYRRGFRGGGSGCSDGDVIPGMCPTFILFCRLSASLFALSDLTCSKVWLAAAVLNLFFCSGAGI